MVNSSYVTVSCQMLTTQLSQNGLSYHLLEHWSPIHWWQLQKVSNKEDIDRTKPRVAAKHLLEAQVYVCQVEAGQHGYFINDQQLQMTKQVAHDFLGIIRQSPVASRFSLMLNWQLE